MENEVETRLHNAYDELLWVCWHSDFEDFIKDTINDKLDEYHGVKVSGYKLSDLLCEEYIANNCVFDSTRESREFIEQYNDEASTTLNDLVENLDYINPWQEPDEFVKKMVISGIDKMLSQSEFVRNHLDKEFKITTGVVNKIKEDLGITDGFDLNKFSEKTESVKKHEKKNDTVVKNDSEKEQG